MKKQHEAVIEVMKENGGFSTLGQLYRDVLLVPNVEWKTKTPFASIRRIVQDSRYFFKIKPGLWALKEFKDKLPPEIINRRDSVFNKNNEFNHSYYQGLLVEIGNLKKLGTYIPLQDKNKKYLNNELGKIASIKKMLAFSYESIVNKAKTIDVIWFNDRKMPNYFFEVEHTTNIQNSLLKFVELQDFHADFFIVADKIRKQEFYTKISSSAFKPMNQRIKFLNYDQVSLWHTKLFELSIIENIL